MDRLLSQKPLHSWRVTVREAVEIQRKLAPMVIAENSFTGITTVAGTDAGFDLSKNLTHAAIVVMDLATLNIVDEALVTIPTEMPYIPGYLSFREAPAIIKACGQLRTMPDLLLCDGQGLAHPRGLGIACHLGVWLDRPAIGVAKSRLIGQHEPPGPEKGSRALLYSGDRVIGAVLRTRSRVKPVYVSIGHRIDLDTAIDYVLKTVTRYRLPEPIRRAHHLASEHG